VSANSGALHDVSGESKCVKGSGKKKNNSSPESWDLRSMERGGGGTSQIIIRRKGRPVIGGFAIWIADRRGITHKDLYKREKEKRYRGRSEKSRCKTRLLNYQGVHCSG